MNYGLYLSAGGVLSNLHRQDVLANNLANAETAGFKADMVFARQRLPERLESNQAVEAKQMLEQLGGGHFVAPTRVALEQGSLHVTGNDLDLAIEGEGFFVVSGPDGADRLTRDGRFTLDAGGNLVMAATGMRVQDTAGRPVQLDRTGPVSVRADGAVWQHGGVVARLRIATADGEHLVKAGHNVLRVDGPDGATRPATGVVRQGHVESSSVDPIMTLNKLIAATKTAQANAKMMQYHDFIMGEAISKFGRVA